MSRPAERRLEIAMLILAAVVCSSVAIEPPVQRITYTTTAYAAWAPDGSGLAYQSNPAGNYDIFTMSADGHRIRCIVESPADDITPVYAPDGKRIAFVSERDGNREVYLCDPDGGNLVNLTKNAAMDIHPSWSRDGRRMLFSSNRGNADADDYDIYSMNADGTGVKQITHGPHVDTYASWSPDGTKIVTRRVVNGNSEVFVMDADGSHAVNLSNSPAYDGWPVWSPDGRRIAYAGGEPGKEVHLFLIDPDGSNRVALTDLAGSEDRHPAFSPHGTMLVFTRYRGGLMESSDLCILRMPRAKG